MTERIYQQDPYCRELCSQITARERRGDLVALRLARTIFCPEGGGQPADLGTIGGLPLRALENDGDDVVHLLDRDPGGEEACLCLDFERRYDHMQQHTAQHLLSQVLVRRFAAATLSFAIGPEHSSIEIDRPAFSEEEIAVLEAESARQVFANLPVRVFSSADGSSLQLRKPPKVQGLIRVVEIEGLDRSACGGTHLKSSAEIGLLKILRCDRVRSHVRLYYAAGTRALRDYQLKHEVGQRIQRAITVPWAEMPALVEALLAERDALRRELKKLRRREMEAEIEALAAGADAWVVREFAVADSAELRFFASALMERGKHVLAYARSPEPCLAIGRGRGSRDLRPLALGVFALLEGRGGGRENLLEGRIGDLSRIAEVIDLLRRELAE